MRTGIGLAVTLTLALAACGSPADDPAPAAQPSADVSAALDTDNDTDPPGGIWSGMAPPGTGNPPNMIPVRFQGIWDYAGGTCAPESDMRMEISGNEILFYEAIGIVIAAEPDGEDMVVTLAMQGEGENWQQQTRLSLVGTGEDQRLETTDGAAPKVAHEYPSKRCPA